MNESTSYVKPRIAREKFGVSDQTLRMWADDGLIKYLEGRGNRRVYDISSFRNRPLEKKTPEKHNYIYCRVSTNKQKSDLDRQIKYLQDKYPSHSVIKEIASGINFKRKGLERLLECAIDGLVGEIVVAHRDRLCRIAWEHFEWLFKRLGVNIVVEDKQDLSPESELKDDLLSIIHVFSSRLYGARRKYTNKGIKEKASEETSKDRESESCEEEED